MKTRFVYGNALNTYKDTYLEKYGDKFAWLPTRMSNKTWVWLKPYHKVVRYMSWYSITTRQALN